MKDVKIINLDVKDNWNGTSLGYFYHHIVRHLLKIESEKLQTLNAQHADYTTI
jgi:hypothetical protein